MALDTPLSPAKKKKRRFLKFGAYIASGLVLAYSFVVAGSVIVFNAGYDLPIFINGASMFPYLNEDAGRLIDGKYYTYSYLDGSSNPGDIIDFGYAKSRDSISILKEVKRYDVVTTYYPSDYATNSDGTLKRDEQGKLILLANSAPKIKRVIGLPNETVSYRLVLPNEETSEFANPIWGETTIISKDKPQGEKLKPVYTVADYKIGDGVYDYPSSSYTWAKSSSSFQLSLGADEYLVAGDNRGYSSDGLSKQFAVSEEMILGKVYYIVGKTKMISDGKKNTIDSNIGYAFSPWNFRRIG